MAEMKHITSKMTFMLLRREDAFHIAGDISFFQIDMNFSM